MERRKGKVRQVPTGELERRLNADRRGELRSDVQLEVDLPLDDWEQVRHVYTTNISQGGLLFTLTPPASMPAALELTLTLPDGAKITLAAQVRHVERREASNDFEVGVQFQPLDPATQRAFDQALAKLPR